MAKTTSLVFVLYDGIEHSIFEGQVLDPLLKKLKKDKTLIVTLVSFEKHFPSEKTLKRLKTQHPRLFLKLFRKTFFLGWFSLTWGAWQLRSYLYSFKSYTLIARGPLAGIIAQNAFTQKCRNLILQARGLLAEEHRFSNTKRSYLIQWIYTLRTKQLAYWEYKAYEYKSTISFTIQTVSDALKQHLKKQYNLTESMFTCAQPEDIPDTITPAQRATLRSTFRAKLKIPNDHTVYVYNGSAKPWQCPRETVLFFKQQVKTNSKTFLLVLTYDVKVFKQICKQENLPLSTYKIITVSHKNILSYLCVADQGILLREKNIINWVSRPTKYLEYKAARLSVIHNHTVAFIKQDH